MTLAALTPALPEDERERRTIIERRAAETTQPPVFAQSTGTILSPT
jgi:hypothetical protein